jgi:hypothetical protein
LHLFGNISRVFSLKDSILTKIIIELTKNVHPDPSKRETLEKTQENFEKICNKFSNWSFINDIHSEKMNTLFEIIGK